MKIEQNTVSRDWILLCEGRRFFVNFTASDGRTLALCNRDNWRICEETDSDVEDVNAYVFDDGSPEEQQRAEENALIIERLTAFCIANWDNGFIQQLRQKWNEQCKSRKE